MPLSLQQMVSAQVDRVIRRGSRAERFDQLRSRHFWSSYLFLSDPVTNLIQAGQYDIFKVIPSGTGQGYPTNVPLSLRETNWLNSGRVPDNQNFVITEIGVTLKRPPAVDALGNFGIPSFAPSNGIWANLPAAQQAHINGGAQNRQICPADAIAILYGTILEMSFLTNNVPLGLCADFSQSAGGYSFANANWPDGNPVPGSGRDDQGYLSGDPLNGIPAAAFRRKLEVPILLQHGENMGMRLNIPRNIEVEPTTAVAPIVNRALGTGWFEIRVDWWAHESFTEKS
jgi:hypothetical protein